MFTRNALLFFVLSAALTGCGSKTVSPALAGLPGIVTDIGADGYPIVKSITFQRPVADSSRVLECMQVEVDGLISVPVEIDGAARARGHFYVSIPIDSYMAFTLSVRGGEYRFEHIATAWIKGPLYELKASAYYAPEKSYQALQSIADRVSACADGE